MSLPVRDRAVRELVARFHFSLCLTFGRLLQSASYSRATIVEQDGERQVRKRRAFHAPILVWLGGPLLRILDTGVRVLPRRQWEERERMLYRSLRSSSVRADADGTLVLPCLTGETLATLLDDPAREAGVRKRAIELAVVALAQLHRLGISHGDAMAENVMVDLDAGVAHWFDFETMHDPVRPMAWRRADDLRALLATCLLRTTPEQLAGTLHLVVDLYANGETTRLLAAHFTTTLRRPLAFHLGQAPLSLQCYRSIDRLLKARIGEQTTT